MKGLVIDEPWISLLLNGRKSWEMRSTHTATRGRIALIRKGSGTVVGVADLVDSIGPLDAIGWCAHQGRHCIPLEQQAATRSWDHAWVMDDVRPLTRPIPYRHPNGAVVWVRLDDEVIQRMEVDHGSSRPVLDRTPVNLSAFSRLGPMAAVDSAGPEILDFVPVAKDGTWFSPVLGRGGGFRIGAKGEEVTIEGYGSALAKLRLMTTPRWRRPNSNGNWGIVSGVEWKLRSELSVQNPQQED